VLAVIFLYLTITSIQRLIEAGEEVEQAEKELEQAKKEYDNTRKNGCPNPIVSAGGVIC